MVDIILWPSAENSAAREEGARCAAKPYFIISRRFSDVCSLTRCLIQLARPEEDG